MELAGTYNLSIIFPGLTGSFDFIVVSSFGHANTSPIISPYKDLIFDFYICGSTSAVKMVNQLLAGVHIASAAEAMAFGARLGLNTRLLFDVIANSGGTSW